MMNEEIINAENEEVITNETGDDAAEHEEMLSRLKKENEELRRRLFCAERNIPSEAADDVICLAAVYAERDGISFEEAATAAFDRICGYGSKKHITDTGVKTENPAVFTSQALRRAFGLR